MKNKDKLKEYELNGKERYYYQKFGDVPRGYLGTATICLIPFPACDEDRPGVVRGVAFCNPLDQFNRKLGRDIALGRAVKAIERGDDSEPVPENTPASILKRERGMDFLSAFNPELSEFEQGLLGVKE